MICWVIFKVVVIFGYQVLFGGCEMLMFYGWGIGGIQLIVSVIGENDVLKVIDQGVDDIINVVLICQFFKCVIGVVIIECIEDVILIQICYWILEMLLVEDQILIYQVLILELLCFIELCEIEICIMYVLEEYGVMQVKLYEDIVCFGYIVIIYVYLVKVNGCYVMDFLLILKFDNLKMYMMLVLQLFGVGCEKWIYVVLFYILVESFDFDDYFFIVQEWDEFCVICGLCYSYFDEVVLDDSGQWMFVCFDIDYCCQQSEGQKK